MHAVSLLLWVFSLWFGWLGAWAPVAGVRLLAGLRYAVTPPVFCAEGAQ